MGHMYLIMVDSHSKWIEVVVMSSITASDIILCLRSIFTRFGLHEHIVTDNGPTFISTKLKEFLRKNSIKDTTSAPYHASTNELVERTFQTVKGGLKRMKEGSIQTILARFLFSYRITPQSTTGFSLAKMMMGRKLHSALDSMKPDLNQRIELRPNLSSRRGVCVKLQRWTKMGSSNDRRNHRSSNLWCESNRYARTLV